VKAWRSTVAVLAVMAAVLLGFYLAVAPFDGSEKSSNDADDVPDNFGAPTEVEAAQPLTSPGTYDDAPGRPPGAPDFDRVTEFSNGDQTRPGGEEFAVSFAHLVIDTRSDDVDIDELIQQATAPSMPDQTRAYLRTTVARQKADSFGRMWLTDKESWIRTEVQNDAALSVEIGYTEGFEPDPSYETWSVIRVDVVRSDGHWAVANLGETSLALGPFEAGQSIRDVLQGGGWRLMAER
jgi:hypothetical protein